MVALRAPHHVPLVYTQPCVPGSFICVAYLLNGHEVNPSGVDAVTATAAAKLGHGVTLDVQPSPDPVESTPVRSSQQRWVWF